MNQPSTRDSAVLDELKDTRAIAQNAVTDALSTRAIMLRMELVGADEKLQAATAEIERLKAANADLTRRLSQIEPDTPSL